MTRNMGSLDRGLRVAVALVLAALYFTGTVGGTLGLVLLALGVVFVATSAIGFCPLYLPLGLNTCGAQNAPKA